MSTQHASGTSSIVEEIVHDWLDQWSGLRLYIHQRRAGGPTDETMDTLLAELVRARMGEQGDHATIMASLFR